MNSVKTGTKRALLAVSVAAFLTGCQTIDRLERVGKEPDLAPIQNPQAAAGYRPVSLPMPESKMHERTANSLWRVGARSFFKDQRASQVGDLLTINIAISDNATMNNTSTRSRNNSEDVDLPNFLGIEAELNAVLPEGVSATDLVNVARANQIRGNGQISRTESINMRVAAIVSQVLPNGNLVIHGRQEVRVNHEVRELQVGGVIRPEDIAATNEINFDEIAEARIGYGGRGFISDVQNAPYGQELFDVIMPF